VLLNTMGKLIKKMISNRLQFDMIKFDLVHPNQVSGVHQCSTEDAGLFLTHLVRTGWAKGKKTSVVAFDIAQFFPSLNHAMLLAILRKQGFSSVVTKFFASYLVDRFTAYMWGSFRSGPRQADIGVGQGSALSPVLSALYIAPVMKLYHMNPVSLKMSLLSFVDDGTVAAQSKSLDENIETLEEGISLLLSLFVALGLVLEHSKTEYFIFDRSHSDYSPPLDLGYAPYTGDNPLKPNLYWRYHGFYFDCKLRSAITLATQQDNCERIYIFTDLIASARRAVDPLVHSGQGHSLAVCRTLMAWLGKDPDCRVFFIQVPSKLEWNIHKEAHDFATSLIQPAGPRPATSLDSVRKAVTKRSQESWTRLFQEADYRGHNFLQY